MNIPERGFGVGGLALGAALGIDWVSCGQYNESLAASQGASGELPFTNIFT